MAKAKRDPYNKLIPVMLNEQLIKELDLNRLDEPRSVYIRNLLISELEKYRPNQQVDPMLEMPPEEPEEIVPTKGITIQPTSRSQAYRNIDPNWNKS